MSPRATSRSDKLQTAPRIVSRHRAAAVACLLLAALHTWPLATAPWTRSLNYHADALLNEWALAWIAHQLPRAPADLFDANIFYPARHSLAFSEPLLAPALLGAPLAWLGGSPVLVYNLLLIAGLALTAFATYALVYEWTGDRSAGLLAGSAFAFNTHTLTRLAHLQGIHIYGLPLALLALDRLLVHGRLRDAVFLSACLATMTYTSGYLAVFGAVAVALAVAARARDWSGRWRPVIANLGVAAALTAVAALPVYLPYRSVAQEYGMARSLEQVTQFSATPAGYLATGGRLHASTWSGRFASDPVDMFFAGFAVIGLAGAGAILALRSRGASVIRSRAVMLLVIAAAGVILSLGTQTPIYGWLFAVFPPMQGLRVAARFGNLYLLGMAALAGLGLAAVRSRVASPRVASGVALAAIALANLEALTAPIDYQRFERVPPVYSLLADERDPVVLVEVPFYPTGAIHENAAYVFASTAHWKPLMNGYSGHIPQSYRDLAPVFWSFPDRRAIEAMRRAGATHVMVHPERLFDEGPAIVRELGTMTDMELVAVGDRGIRLYRFK
jgi:hypothetical protein